MKATKEKDSPRYQSMSPESRENEAINSAMSLAERQILEGTASSQIITYFLKRGAEREREKLENEKLRNENKLLLAKVEALQTASISDEKYDKVIQAFKGYSGESYES
jgi:hypothetical protein